MIFAHKEKDLLSKCYSEDIKPSFFPSKQRKGIFYMTAYYQGVTQDQISHKNSLPHHSRPKGKV